MSIREAAQSIGVSYQTMWKWVRDGKVPSVKFGAEDKAARRILVKDFQEFLEQYKEV